MVRLSALIRPWNSTSGSTVYQQDNWFGLLQLTEFTYNNAPSATTTITPFYANKGYHLNLTIHLEWELASSQAKEFITDLDELHQHL